MTLDGDTPHILVVDDDGRLRELLRRYLVDNGFLVSTAESAADARSKLAALDFDLIVLDVMMPGETGLELTESLRSERDIPILLLTAMGNPTDRIRGLEVGADDYLPKPFEPRELVLRLQSILRRREPAPSVGTGIVRLGELVFDPAREELRRGDERIALTTAEAGLLAALAAQPGRILSREDLSGSQAADGAASRAIDVQVTRLRRKIEPDPKLPRYLHTVRGEGYVLRPDG